MKRPALTLTAALATLAIAGCGGGSAAATHTTSTTPAAPAAPVKVIIHHETKGCHAWAVDGQTPQANASVSLAVGGTMLVTDDDVMPHTLMQTGGPSAQLIDPAMRHMGSAATVTFAKAGVYTFTTKAGEDYMSGIQTTGPDNTLKMTVTVA
jgi:plastocyanin